jgi:lysophospholipase L1-like esterase
MTRSSPSRLGFHVLAVCAALGLACGSPSSAAGPARGDDGAAGSDAPGGVAAPSDPTGAGGGVAASGGTSGTGEAVPPDMPASSEGELGELPLAGGGVSGSGGATPPSPDPSAGGAPASGGASAVPPAPEVAGAPLTVWIAGDSTVANGQTPCPRGWGGVFAPHFDERVTVNNSAAGGRSVQTWLYEVQTVMEESGECALGRDDSGAPLLQPRWQAMLDGMAAGDYLFIQFGINDGDPSCDRHVGIEAFKAAYAMMADAAFERGAHPIFLTPVSSISCNGNTARGSRGAFVPATFEAGEASGVPVIDLHARSVALFQARGFCPVAGGDVSADTTGPVGDFFCDDHTHFSPSGAVEIAELVAEALRDQQIPLAQYLR